MLITNARVLLVSDDLEVGHFWSFLLGQAGLEVTLVSSAQEAVNAWADEVPNLIILDAYTPRLDTITLIRELRAEATIPILLIANHEDESYILNAYDVGADDHIGRPFNPRLFIAKIRAWLRRSSTVPIEIPTNYQVGDLRLESAQHRLVTTNGVTIKLTNLEFHVLLLLMSHPGQIVESNLIINRVWGYLSGGDKTVLKNVIYRLRRKIEPDPAHPRYIQSAAGEGYWFQDD